MPQSQSSSATDQFNLIRKAKQVRLMQQVYGRAHKVVVQLGEKASDGNIAFNFIKLHGKSIRQANRDNHIRVFFYLVTAKYAAHQKAIENLLSRKQWSKVWTTQEPVVSRYMISSMGCGQLVGIPKADCQKTLENEKHPINLSNQVTEKLLGLSLLPLHCQTRQKINQFCDMTL